MNLPNVSEERLLFVDDDIDILHAIKRMSRNWPWHIETCSNGADAIQKISEQSYACIVSDVRMPCVSGIDVLAHALDVSPQSSRILLSGLSTLQDAIEAINICRADQFLLKPCEPEQLQACLERQVAHYSMAAENTALHEKVTKQNDTLKLLNKKLLSTIELKHKSMLTSWKIQSSLLIDSVPKHLHNSQICCYTIPAQELNGDLILFHKYSDHLYDVVVGDVMGKGITAALQAAAVKSAFQFEWGRQSQGANDCIKQILSNVAGKTVAEISEINSFISMFYCRIDTKNACIEYIDCGSAKPYFIAHDGTEQKLKGKNMPFGVSGVVDDYQIKKMPFNDNDLLVLYSDGIVEAMPIQSDEMFGEERLKHILSDNKHLTAQDIGNIIQRSVRSFTGKSGHLDDFTVVVIKFTADKNTDPTKRIAKQHEYELYTGMDKEQFYQAITLSDSQQDHAQTLWELFCYISTHHYNNDSGLPIWMSFQSDSESMHVYFYDYGHVHTPASSDAIEHEIIHDVDSLARNCTSCTINIQ